MGHLKGKQILSVYSYINKDTKSFQYYVHIYNISITKHMIIKHNFELENWNII